MVKANCVGFKNAVNIGAIEYAHSRVAYIIPPWVQDFSIEAHPEANTDDVACVAVDSRYRRARVYLSPGFFTESANEQTQILRHEYTHILLGGLAEMIAEREDDPRWEYFHECATEDIARLLESMEPKV